MTKLPQLNWLYTFEVAARRLSFTDAAQELNMTQSAVSQQIRLLEHQLDQQLFTRLARGIQLTDTGRAYLPVVQEAFQYLNRGTVEIFSPLKSGMLSLNVNTAFGVLWLAPRLSRFNKLYPQVNIRLLNTNWVSDFKSSTADLEIRHGTGDWDGFESHQLISPKLRPYCSPQIAALLKEPEKLADIPLLEVMGLHNGWDEWFKAANLPELKTIQRHQVDSAAISVSMAANGFGVCLSYDELADTSTLTQKLVAPFTTSIATTDSYYLTYQNNRPLSKAAAIFKDWLLADLNINDSESV